MTIGAVIVAAGMSSRMGDFKPMLNVGSITIAERVIANFHQAGITRIAVVTGFNAETLEHHLASQNLVFLRNENYEHTQMFDSVRIGLEYMKDKVDAIFFTPIDVPLFTAATVEAELACGAPLVTPVCEGKPGHPILIRSSLVDAIAAYSGDRGLKGAMESCGTEMTYLAVDDRGTIHDADTPEDYRALLQLHNESLIRPSIGVSLAKEKEFFDARMATLLTLVEETGTVREASGRMHISYSAAWNIIRTLESQLSQPLIERSQGGKAGGRSRLTEYGKKLLKCYDEYSAALRRTAGELFEEYFHDVF